MHTWQSVRYLLHNTETSANKDDDAGKTLLRHLPEACSAIFIVFVEKGGAHIG